MKPHLTQTEILDGLRTLTPAERLSVIETALHLTRVDLESPACHSHATDIKLRMVEAAEALKSDYAGNGDLTIFTTLDREGFHEER